MNNKRIGFISLSSGLIFACALSASGCNRQVITHEVTDFGVQKAVKDPYDATLNSIVSTDVYGRSFGEGDVGSSDRRVGMFYFIWHGEHVSDGIFDVTELSKTEEGRQELWNKDSTVSLLDRFHYFSQPLYGYYCSDDPWILARHIELLTMSGIDYISLDLTNLALYEENVTAVLEALLKYQSLGWKVPKVTSFLTGTYKAANHPDRVNRFYDIFYTNPRYDSLWFRDINNGKPIIEIDRNEYYSGLNAVVTSNLAIRNTIWPYDKRESQWDDASWMDWTYPQRLYENSDGNYMNVSVSHHNAGSFGMSVNPKLKDQPNRRTRYAEEEKFTFDTGAATNYDSNKGRGWDYELNKNVAANAFKGTNLEQQWKNALTNEKGVDEVFVTGWNEWVAYKSKVEVLHGQDCYKDLFDEITFCDTCNEEFSRDLEMTKDGYGDNFYLQNMRLTRQFKFKDTVKYAGAYSSKSLQDLNWNTARSYLDFTGEVMERNFDRADHKEVYTNTTNRNDIKETKVSHDDNYLYIQVQTLNDIIVDEGEENNLNILLSINGSTAPNWNGYNFALNRKGIQLGSGETTLQKVFTDGEYAFEDVTNCASYLKDNVMSIAIPLEALGVNTKDGFTIDFKVADGISDCSDIMNYYIDGDSAPIGRLNYRYNSARFAR